MRARVILAVAAAAVVAGAGVLLASRDGSPPSSPAAPAEVDREALPARVVDAGDVQVRIEPLFIDGMGADFIVSLDTHSGDLDVDLGRTARLEVDGKDWGDATWDGDPPGGHHRSGSLSFESAGPARGQARLTIDGLPRPVVVTWSLG